MNIFCFSIPFILLKSNIFGIIISVLIGVIYLYLRIKFEPKRPVSYPNGLRFVIQDKDNSVVSILEQDFEYFRKLTPDNRKQFVSKLTYFMNDLEFVPFKGMIITKDIAVLISASFVQLTFGLEKNILNHFNLIFVFPKQYYNSETRKTHIGEVNLSGYLVISWDDFSKGYSINDDAINVGIHEMAHALYFEIIQERYSNSDLFEKVMKIYNRAKHEIEYSSRQLSCIRKYAYLSPPEYFAVVTEYFFEKPRLLAEEHPKLFAELLELYNQNPL